MKRVIPFFLILLCIGEPTLAHNFINFRQKSEFNSIEFNSSPIYVAQFEPNVRNSHVGSCILPTFHQSDFRSSFYSWNTHVIKTNSSGSSKLYNQFVLPVNISYPWYKTPFTEVLIILLVFSLIVGFVIVIINRQKQQNLSKLDKKAIKGYNHKIDFLSDITSELINPLSLVVSPAEDLKNNSNSFDEKWRIHIDMIYRNSRYIQKLVNQIIDFNKFDTGKLKLVESNSNLSEIIRDVSSNFEGIIKKKNIKYELQLPVNDIIVKIDSPKIEDVLYNLLYYSLMNTDGGIKISLYIKEPQGSDFGENDVKQIQISILIECASIRKNTKEKLYEHVLNIDKKSDDNSLGLTYAKALIEMHHGTINIESIDGGVTLNIILPYIKSDITIEELQIKDDFEPRANENAENIQKQSNLENGERLKVFIAEDKEELRNFLIHIFSEKYKCFTSSNGNEAYKIILEAMPEIIICDSQMAGMDGFQLCRMVKENRQTCHIPIILLIAKGDDEKIISALNSGADAYLIKPISVNVLLAQVSRMIRNRELIREKYLTQNFMVEIVNTSTSKDDEFIITLRSILEENIADADFNVNKLSKQMNISTTQLYRKLKTLTGYSPVEFVRILKLQKACELLNQRKNTIKEVCYLVGFNNLSYFVKCFREFFGVTPAVYRDQGLTETAKAETNEEL
jgi:DNA-binding response OmpR family regulator/signal transduction histidine kinase